ncbi:unnamed protein product [Chilo suppressalis]|uniref:G-protein coupled receptors family 2 profile 2 domain-containing protein n=2 Tax=Chilo suppressalis TaxID=168631 RepID=A0ABN8AU39_CHISP|nr:unnamed protein product [Chilo suppressalis]
MQAVLLAILFVLIKECYSAECEGKICVRKCCPDNQYITGIKKCANSSEDLDLNSFDVYDDQLSRIGDLKQYFRIKPGAFNDVAFKERATWVPGFYLMENGSVIVPRKDNKGNKILIMYNNEDNDYCIDYKLKKNSSSHKVVLLMRVVGNQQTPFLVYSLPISSFFLFLVLVVYALLPDLRNLGGLVLMGYVGSMLLAYLFLFTIQSEFFQLSVSSCITITLLICYFFLATFCWMNVMSYDIWWTFRGYAKARPIHRRGVRFKYTMYSMYAWGVPLALTILTGAMNSADSKKLPGVIKPAIPLKGCFIQGEAKLVYLYIPMLIMIIVNWMFYLMTAFNIWRLSRGNKVLDSADSATSGTASARRTNKERFLVYLKLSALMGLSWILEVVSSFTKKHFLWHFTDAYNIFMGLMIFIIFVCKRKIFKQLQNSCYSCFQIQAAEPGSPGVVELYQPIPQHARVESSQYATEAPRDPLSGLIKK